MNTNRLTKLYPTLTAMERLRLIHDAGKRGDALERQRLLNSAPRRHFSMADSGELENHLRHCATMFYAFQLGNAADFWHAQTRAAWALAEIPDGTPISDDAQFWTHTATLSEALFAIERDGWYLFIEQNGIDLAAITVPELAGHPLLPYMDEHAESRPEVAEALEWLANRETANATVRAAFANSDSLITPDSVADGWHRFIAELVVT